MDRLLLILDLDETLVYATEHQPASFDFKVGPYWVRKRPHLSAFLHAVSSWYDLAVWTSSSAGYAKEVIGHSFGALTESLKFVWCSDRCTIKYDFDSGSHISTKQLAKLRRRGYRLERILILDDSPEKHRSNYGNLVRVKEWTGDPDDRDLLDVLPFLEKLRTCENVRQIEKRGWRTVRLA